MLASSKPKMSRRLSSLLFGSKDRNPEPRDKAQEPASQASANANTNANAKPPTTTSTPAADKPGNPPQSTARHASAPTRQPPQPPAAPSGSAQQSETTVTPTLRTVSAPMPPSGGDQSALEDDNGVADITQGIGDVRLTTPDGGLNDSAGAAVDASAISSTQPAEPINQGPEESVLSTTSARGPTITTEGPKDGTSRTNISTGYTSVANGSRTSLAMSPPPSLAAAGDHRRYSQGSSKTSANQRNSLGPGSKEDRSAKTRSWALKSSDKKGRKPAGNGLRAWVAGGIEPIPYDLTPLLSGEMIPEKIDEAGDSSVFLFPKASGRGPSFRIDSAYFAASPSLTFLAHQMDAQQYPSTEVDDDARSVSSTHTRDDAPDDDIAQELQLFLPVPLTGGLPATGPVTHDEDIDMLVLFRNLFAFLVGQSLVATPRFPDLYHILVEIAGLLRRFEFSNLDGSTLGEIVTSSFNSYCNELDLMDMHNDPRRMLQACVLGERMRFYPLYHQGFTFAVGRYNDLETLPEWAQMSNAAKQRIQRAHMELENRINNVTERLTEFSFPSLFSGIANSTVNNEAGLVRFKNWKAATSAMHKFVLHLLKARHGSWPPKPVSKTIPALNRMVLQRLYADMCDLYDILVDRTSLTDRTIDMTTVLNDQKVDPKEAAAKALRGVMSEFDRSSPPVAPPIPFDIPRLPNMDGLKSVKRKTQDKKAQARESARKLTSGEINEILFSSYNTSSMKSTPFLEHFFEFERRQASGKSCNELADNRCGQWLFMYAVIQSLPMTTVDAPDLLFKDGVPSFLCVPPRGGAPWVKDDPKGGKSWYNVVGGNGVVELPSDLVAYSTEGIFRRSHCWDMATLWAREAGLDTPGEDPYTESPVEEYVDEQEQWQHQMPGQFPPLDGTPQPYEHPTSMSITGSEFQSYAGHPQYPQQYTRSRTASMIEGSMDRGYTPLPSQQFPSMQASQYQPYVAPASESPMASPPALRNSGASFGALSAHGQPGPAVLSQHASSQQSVTSSSSNTTGSGNTGSATGRTLPPMLLPANGSSPALSQSGSQSPMSMSQYPCPPPQSLSPISSRPQSPSVVGVGGHPYGVVPRARVPRQTSANRASATHRSSIYAGIEQLPLPQGVVPLDPAPSRVSTYNPNASFDAILKDVSNKDGKKGKKK